MRDVYELEPHPAAEELPALPDVEYRELLASIKSIGLIQPIAICDGKILDGRQRYRACLEAGIEPKFETANGCETFVRQVEFVMAVNLHRRHLSDAQRALIAGRLNAIRGVSLSDATKLLNVRSRTVQKAAVVVKRAESNVIDLVHGGNMSIDAAYRETVNARGPGRPAGNAKVAKLRRVMADIRPLVDGKKEIVDNWPGNPSLNLEIARASKFFASLVKETREPGYDETSVA